MLEKLSESSAIVKTLVFTGIIFTVITIFGASFAMSRLDSYRSYEKENKFEQSEKK